MQKNRDVRGVAKPSPNLDLTESRDGSIHHFKVQFSEFDITTSKHCFSIQDT